MRITHVVDGAIYGDLMAAEIPIIVFKYRHVGIASEFDNGWLSVRFG